MGVRVRACAFEPGKTISKNDVLEFGRVPNVGEYFYWDSRSNWCRVYLVVHCPFKDADCSADIYGEMIDDAERVRLILRKYT
jgi:hypothetical protein